MVLRMDRNRWRWRQQYAMMFDFMEDETWWRPWAAAPSASQKPYSRPLLVCRIIWAKGSGDLLSHSLVHADARVRVDYVGGTRNNKKRQNLTQLFMYFLLYIYREKNPRPNSSLARWD